jgi:hypothetical protein
MIETREIHQNKWGLRSLGVSNHEVIIDFMLFAFVKII